MRKRIIEIGGTSVEIGSEQKIWRDGPTARLTIGIPLRSNRHDFGIRLCTAEYLVIKYQGIILDWTPEGRARKFYFAVDLPASPGDIERASRHLNRAAREYRDMVKNKILPPESL